MSDLMITPDESKILARQLFLRAFPDSSDWFDLVWQTYLETILPLPKSELPIGLDISAWQGGKAGPGSSDDFNLPNGLQVVGAADPAMKEMAREIAILFETFMQKYPVAKEALIERLEVSAKKHGKNDRATARLKKKLEESLRQRQTGFSENNNRVLIVEQLADGRFSPLAQKSSADVAEILKNSYDIVVDETADTAKIRRQTVKIYEIAPRLRGMLWLILNNTGRSRKITYPEIAKLFCFSQEAESSRDNKVYQYRVRMTEWLGETLCNTIFGPGVGKTYPLQQKGWSFCWVRENTESAKSALIHQVPGINPPEIT